MACDMCGAIDQLEGISAHLGRYLPFRYLRAQVCPGCIARLNRCLDYWRAIAWQKTALMLVDAIKERKG